MLLHNSDVNIRPELIHFIVSANICWIDRCSRRPLLLLRHPVGEVTFNKVFIWNVSGARRKTDVAWYFTQEGVDFSKCPALVNIQPVTFWSRYPGTPKIHHIRWRTPNGQTFQQSLQGSWCGFYGAVGKLMCVIKKGTWRQSCSGKGSGLIYRTGVILFPSEASGRTFLKTLLEQVWALVNRVCLRGLGGEQWNRATCNIPICCVRTPDRIGDSWPQSDVLL